MSHLPLLLLPSAMLFLASCAPLWDNCNAWKRDECMTSVDGTISAKSDSPSQNQPQLYTIVGEDAFTLHLIWYLISRIYPIRSYIFQSYKIVLYIVSRCFQLKKTLVLSFNFIRIKMLWNISSQNMFFFFALGWVMERSFKNELFQNSHRYDLATSKKAILISTVVSSSVGCFLIAF